MKNKYFIFTIMIMALSGCYRGAHEDVVETDVGYVNECVDSNCQIIRYDMPNGNDLVLETPRHIIQIDAQPNVRYSYRVWAGNKTTSDDADLIVDDGNAMILVEE